MSAATQVPPFAKGGLGGIKLLTDHIAIWTDADTERKSGRGRSSGNATSVYGIRKLRELILELAVRGKLVPQDANDEPASALLKRIQTEKAKLIAEGKIKKEKSLPSITGDEKPFELPQGWEWARLGNLFDVVYGKGLSNSELTEEGYEVFGANGIIGRYSSYSYSEPQLLISCRGAYSGKPNISPPFCFITSNTLVLQNTWEYLNLQFFFYALTIADKEKIVTGSAQPQVTTTNLDPFLVVLPPLAEQHRIVAKVDELMAQCDQLETRHNNAADAHEKLVSHLLGTLTQSQNAEYFSANWQRIAAHFDTLFTTEASIDALKQALLQLAVMGKLVPQNPNDEPASELLKRYKIASTTSFITGWSKVSLGALGDIYGGATPSKAKPEYWVGSIPWISPKDMKRFYIDDAEDKVSESAIRDTALKLIPAGSLLMVVRGMILAHSFPVALTTSEVTINQDMKALVVPGEIKDYLLLCMRAMKNSFVALVDRSSHGTCKLISEKLWTAIVAIPPLSEQHRIVAKVDELMALCDQLKTRITQTNQLQQKLADVVVEQAIA